MKNQRKEAIQKGKTALGIELGSTRIKAVLIDETYEPIASGSHSWENQLRDGIWTYSLEEVWSGLRDCYRKLTENVREQYGEELTVIGSIGISGMMHGYLAFDREGRLLAPFRTWRNTISGEAAEELTRLFGVNVPERWSIAHLYQAVLNGEEHVPQIDYLTTLAGYIHWKLTGRKVLGIGDASGMFPVDSAARDYQKEMLEKFDGLTEKRSYPWKLRDILPQILTAGQPGGYLTKEGAALLDTAGRLEPGIPFCPPEGDAQTGMAATNCIKARTGNISAGTSIFAMVVLERDLSRLHREIDTVMTPDGKPVAMAHANNCASDLDAWVGIFREFAREAGVTLDDDALYGLLYRKAMEGDADCGGLLSYGYLSGESMTQVEEGRPMFIRTPDSAFHLANFMRSHLYGALGAMKIGMDILMREEGVRLDRLLGHGGLFKTKGTAQKILADALNTPVMVMDTAGEGGPWGMALLAAFMRDCREGEFLENFLEHRVFAGNQGTMEWPDPETVKGYETYQKRYQDGLAVERMASKCLKGCSMTDE
ncbi:MAG: FGGY-family carbohydrate kinase [Lachnospiraceae bacterium]|nr:FGGY-family carbohydrate kinase [Lachnospiraceae bacterium]